MTSYFCAKQYYRQDPLGIEKHHRRHVLIGTMAMENATGGKKTILPFRYLMAVMGSIGFAILYGFKVNASVAIVAMVNHTALKSHIKLSTLNDSKTDNTTLTSTNICQFDDTSNVMIESEVR